MAHSEHTGTCFTHHGKGFRQQCLQILTLSQAFAEFNGLVLELIVRELFHLRPELIDGSALLAVLPDQPVVAAAENLGENRIKHSYPVKEPGGVFWEAPVP